MPRFAALVDADPDGMSIMSTYKYGSKAHAHDNGKLNTRSLQWLGVRMADLVEDADPEGDGVFQKLSARDRKKAVAILKNSPVLADQGPELAWRIGLQRMLMLNVKGEIEAMYEARGGVEAWIERGINALRFED